MNVQRVDAKNQSRWTYKETRRTDYTFPFRRPKINLKIIAQRGRGAYYTKGRERAEQSMPWRRRPSGREEGRHIDHKDRGTHRVLTEERGDEGRGQSQPLSPSSPPSSQPRARRASHPPRRYASRTPVRIECVSTQTCSREATSAPSGRDRGKLAGSR